MKQKLYQGDALNRFGNREDDLGGAWAFLGLLFCLGLWWVGAVNRKDSELLDRCKANPACYLRDQGYVE